MTTNLNQSETDAIRRLPHLREAARMNTAELRAAFLVPALYAPGQIQLLTGFTFLYHSMC